MTNEFIREDRYLVFKISDLGNSIKGDEIRRLAREYAEQRRLKGKKPLECVVVEKDWPEYESTWKAIEARVTGAQPAPSVPELLESLRCACNYIDKLGGVSQQYRAVLAAPETKPAPSIAEGWKEAAIAWEVCGSLHREYAKGKDPFFKKRQEDFVKHANYARTMLAAAPEAKP